MFVQEIERHLREMLIPFWEGMADYRYGGFYGYLDYGLKLERQAVKGAILNSRILWFFSNAYQVLGEPDLLGYADHAYRFLKEHCLDKEYGGVFWSLAYDGDVEDDTKHTYNQAFAIYALASYYEAGGHEEALELALSLFHLIERKCRDTVGYGEAYDRQFVPVSNEKLSENGVMASRTMNTLLHVFEAYTGLYRVTKDSSVAEKMKEILDVFADRIYNTDRRRQEVFFNDTWESLIDLHSYGHDIEASWLLGQGINTLGDGGYTEKIKPILRTLAAEIYSRAYRNHSILNECENGIDNSDRIWWVQAEGVVGFLNAWEDGRENGLEPAHYLEAAMQIWDYIKEHLVDGREGSEWFWRVDETGSPIPGSPVVSPWKGPYHNGRMCLEVMKRCGRYGEELS